MKTLFQLIIYIVFFSASTKLTGQSFSQQANNNDSLMIMKFIGELSGGGMSCKKVFDVYFSNDSIIYTRLHRSKKKSAYYVKKTLPKMKSDILKYGPPYKLYSYDEAYKKLGHGYDTGVLELDETTSKHTYVATMIINQKEVVWRYFLILNNKILATEYDTDMQSILNWW